MTTSVPMSPEEEAYVNREVRFLMRRYGSQPERQDDREARERMYEAERMQHILRARVQGVRWV